MTTKCEGSGLGTVGLREQLNFRPISASKKLNTEGKECVGSEVLGFGGVLMKYG